MGAVTSNALDLITGALRNINVQAAGEPLAANDSADALQVLNDLLDSLSTDKLFVYTANEAVLAWTPGQFQYSIGNPTQGTFTGYTVLGSPFITGITNPSSLTITFGINASGVTVGGTLTDTSGAIPSGTTIVSLNTGITTSITFTGTLSAGATNGTLTGWSGGAQPYGLITFASGETRTGAITSGGAVTWYGGLSQSETAAGGQVNTTTITMSANANQTTTVADQITYTAPGNFAIPRPLRVRSGYTRITASGNTGLDYWWDTCNLDDYNEIGYKGVPGPWPYLVCYQPTYPYGTLWVYPNPQQAGQVYFWSDVILSNFTTLTQTIALPQGYARALKKLLAIELAPEYGKSPSPELLRQAWEARQFIKNLNDIPVKKLRYDSALMAGNGKDASFIMHGGFGSNL
jgi:hypothetical protein